jgi:hypothetical protein
MAKKLNVNKSLIIFLALFLLFMGSSNAECSMIYATYTTSGDCYFYTDTGAWCGSTPTDGACYEPGYADCHCCRTAAAWDFCRDSGEVCSKGHCCPTGDVWNGTKCEAISEFPTAFVGIIAVTVAVLGSVFIPKVVSKAKSGKAKK